MSNFKRKFINILYKSKLDLNSNQKKAINCKINTNEINNITIKKYNNDYSLENSSYIPIPTFKKKEYFKDLSITKDKYNNLTLLNSKIKNNKKKFFIPKNSKLSINNNVKNKIINIPTFSNANINTLYNKLNIKKNYFYLKNNNKRKIINTYKIKEKEYIRKKPLFTEFNTLKSLKINKKNNYSTKNVKKFGNMISINKIKEKIKKMENEFSSNETKKILINRPVRTLNSQSFQFNSKEFKNLSPTFHVLNHLKIKKNNGQKKLTSFFSERYRNNMIKAFKRNYYSSNNLFEKFSLRKSGAKKMFELNILNNNKSSDKNNIFSTKIKLKTNERNNLFNEVMKFRNYYKIPVITSEYQRYSKYIRNENRKLFLKNTLFNSSNINQNQDFTINKSSQFSYRN